MGQRQDVLAAAQVNEIGHLNSAAISPLIAGLLLRRAVVLPYRVVRAIDHVNALHRVTVIVLCGRVQHRARRAR